MQGQPLTRTTAADGSWAYTLYDSREYPFIHALPLGQGALGGLHRAAGGLARPRGHAAAAHRPGNKLEVLSAKGDVLATADLAGWKLELASAGLLSRPDARHAV